MAAAAFMIGKKIHILEELKIPGGSM